MVETLGARRLHPALGHGICPRRPEWRANLLYTKVPHTAIEAHAKAAIAIVNQKSRGRALPGAAFDDLLGGPIGRRMLCYLDVKNLPIGKPDHEEDIERLK
jgi:hypothetical protein